MYTQTDVNEWIEWWRKTSPQIDGYPIIDKLKITGGWEDTAEEDGLNQDRSHVLDDFMRRLAATPNDFSTRFVSIHYYWSAWNAAQNYNIDEIQISSSQQEEAINRTFANLALIIRFLPVDDVPADWNAVIWEVSNARLINDHTRALALYNRAEQLALKPRSELQVIRGHFRLMVVLAKEAREFLYHTFKSLELLELPSFSWVPPLISQLKGERSDDVEETSQQLTTELERLRTELELLVMFKLGLAGGNVFDWQREWCEDAATDLKRGLTELTHLATSYKALLARALFLSERFCEAASMYQELLRTTERGVLRDQLYNSIILSYDSANDNQNLKVWLSRQLQDSPNVEGNHLRLAELEWQDCNYEEAVGHLRREVDLHPEADVDWTISAILTSSEMQNLEPVQAALRQSPVWDSINDILRFHWRPFTHMCAAAQEEWVVGFWFGSFAPLEDRKRPTVRRKAAVACVTAAEIEVRERIFDRFKKYINSKPQLRSKVTSSRDEVLRAFVLDDRRLALGEMVVCLSASLSATDPLQGALRLWLAEHAPSLKDQTHLLKKIVKFRNPATHESADACNPEEVMLLCRKLIDDLVR